MLCHVCNETGAIAVLKRHEKGYLYTDNVCRRCRKGGKAGKVDEKSIYYSWALQPLLKMFSQPDIYAVTTREEAETMVKGNPCIRERRVYKVSASMVKKTTTNVILSGWKVLESYDV